MIVLRSPKGWTGPKKAHGQQIEGTFHAHQVPLPNVKTDNEEFQLLKEWLHSYHPEQLFDTNGSPVQELVQAIPPENLRMGQRPETYSNYEPLDLADWKDFVVEGKEASEMKVCLVAVIFHRFAIQYRCTCIDYSVYCHHKGLRPLSLRCHQAQPEKIPHLLSRRNGFKQIRCCL